MEEHHTNHLGRPSVGHETSDVNIWAIGKFGIGLVIVTLLSVGLLIGVFQFFKTRDGREAQIPDPTKMFPTPQVLVDEPKGLAGFKAVEEKTVTSYGWVDQQKGIVRIPVEQAMDLLVKRGLPVRAQAAAQGYTVSMPTESGLGAPLPKPQEEPKK